MKEDFLHYLWKHQLFSKNNLRTTNNFSLAIHKSGTHNSDSGPDFFNAKIQIDNQLWAGNVEIHIKASDWYLHQHEQDKNYDNVILHVVWENDANIFRKNNTIIPTLILKNYVSKNLVNQYQKLFLKQPKWIACDHAITTTDAFVRNNWLEVLFFERLRDKTIFIKELLDKSANDWETVLFLLLAKNFGLKVNGDAFFNLAMSINYKILRKEKPILQNLEALLFGQAGFLEKENEDMYFINLQKEYQYLQNKYNLDPIFNGQFQFFRLRPNNFPTLRLAQLAMLLNKHQNLFVSILKAETLEDYYTLFKSDTSDYWKTHYNFNTKSKKHVKVLTKSFIHLLLINTIIPLKFMYLKHIGKLNNDVIIALIQQIPSEKNTVINKFTELFKDNLIFKSVLESQALLQLKNKYCNHFRCLECAIGNAYLKQVG